MIQWVTKLYIGDKLAKKKEKVIASINQKEATFDVYCIAFASQSSNLFDVLNANELLFPHYRRRDVSIVGIAKGREEAILLVKDMLLEVYNKTGGFDVRNYFT